MKPIRLLFLLFLFLQSVFPGKAGEIPTLYRETDRQKMTQWVDSVFDSMTLDERIGQLFMIVADPGTNSVVQKNILKNIKEQHVGGILFAKGDLTEQAISTNLYQKNSKVPLLISLDGEWGLSMRLRGTPKFPRNMVLGAITDNDWLYRYGEEVGQQCRKMGIHINFAPVLDVNCNPDNPVIGTRSFGENPYSVASKGIAYSKGLESTGVIAVAKHFPGHGDTSEDSHATLPVIRHDSARLTQVELYPFVQYINAGFSGVMTGHLSVPALDNRSGKPTSLSPVIIKDLLQNKLEFSGLTFSDALVMKGARSDDGSICVQAILAGNDILLSPANPAAEFRAVKKAVNDGILTLKDIEERCIKILSYKYIVGLNNYKPINTKNLQGRINSSYAEQLIRRLNAESITLLKDPEKLVPVKKLENKKIAVVSIGEKGKTGFQETIGLYAKADHYNIPLNASESAVKTVIAKLKNYNTVIFAIHSSKVPYYSQLRPVTVKKETHVCFFITPYSLKKYKGLIDISKTALIAYENTEQAQEAAAQVIMGGLPAKGKLPVKVSGLFAVGTGISTDKVRLTYSLPEEVKMSAQKLKRIDSIVKDAIDKKAFPGCQILIAKNGSVVYNKSFGYFDYAGTHPVRNSDLYDLASVTKAAATVPAIMKLYDEKKIKTEDALSRFVPELRKTDKDSITVREALFHESGLVSFFPFYQSAIDKSSYSGSLFSSRRDLAHRIQYDVNTYARTDFKFKPEFISTRKDPNYKLQIARDLYLKDSFRKRILKDIAGSNLKKKGSYVYSDLNFMLLKEAVEHISGQDFDQFLDATFYAPLGAATTTFNPLKKADTLDIAPTENDQFLRKQILIGFVHDEAAAFMGGVSGNAGLFSNANDLAKLLQMILNGGAYGDRRFLSKETCKLFTETKSPISRRGLGFDKPEPNKNKTNPCSESTPLSAYGHTGFTGTCFWVDPKNELIYIFLSNRIYPSRTHKDLMKLNVRSKIQEVIYDAMG